MIPLHKSLLGNASMTDAYRTGLINFIKGNNLDGTPRYHMGDIIHSKPLQLHIAGGRNIIFVGSNEGYLHAINDYDDVTNANNGTEAFAYMPSELLSNIDRQFKGNLTTSGHMYGVDGPVTLWIDETNSTDYSKVGNSVLDTSNNEKAYIFFGLRRGGMSYFALEVTDPDNPQLVWKINNTSPYLANLGHTWSQPVVAQLKWKPHTNLKPVVVFGGGYNEDTDGDEIAGGNAVFIRNALDGSHVWSTEIAEADSSLAPDKIDNAVPSRIRALDIDRNGSIDRLYFGDTDANIWRVDLNASNYNADTTDNDDITKAQMHKFAELKTGDRQTQVL